MRKVLLVNLCIDYKYEDIDKTLRYPRLKRKPKLGLLYLCSVIEKNNNFFCEIFDQEVTPFSLNELIKKISKENLFFLGFYSHSLIKDKLIEYIRKIKKIHNVPIIIGGPGYIHNSEFLNNGCDIVVHGEGEKTILEIVKHLKGNIPIKQIKGISYKEDGRVVYNGPQDLIENLDEIPFPNRDKVSIRNYYDYYIFASRVPYVTMITSRGCPFRCLFCNSSNIWSERYRVRSVENVIKEIDFLIHNYKAKYIAFQDDIFGWNQEWLKDFCYTLIDKKYDLNWMCILHPFSLSSEKEKSIELMRKAGCNLISFGLQSTDSEILKNINRDPKEPQVLAETIYIAKKKGILTVLDFILGLPGETEESVVANIKYSLRVKPHLVDFHPLLILPATPLDYLYRDKHICNFKKDELIKWSTEASRRFYLNLNNMFQIFRYIAKKNPLWLIKSPLFLRFIFDIVGFK